MAILAGKPAIVDRAPNVFISMVNLSERKLETGTGSESDRQSRPEDVSCYLTAFQAADLLKSTKVFRMNGRITSFLMICIESCSEGFIDV